MIFALSIGSRGVRGHVKLKGEIKLGVKLLGFRFRISFVALSLSTLISGRSNIERSSAEETNFELNA